MLPGTDTIPTAGFWSSSSSRIQNCGETELAPSRFATGETSPNSKCLVRNYLTGRLLTNLHLPRLTAQEPAFFREALRIGERGNEFLRIDF
jgi:hypothetical protein